MQLPGNNILVFMGVGGLFVILAVLAIVWSIVEERSYYNAMLSRVDLREYLHHWPPRPEAGALRTGGWIMLAIGVILLAVGGYFWIARIEL